MKQLSQQQQATAERELPMLAGIGAIVTWFEDLLNILSGPVITAGLVIALVALLTDGDLLVKVPAMLYIWSVSMALGLDAQFVGSAAKMARAARQRKWLAVFGYGVLCAALGYVGYIASNVFATQEAEGITTAQALQHLGMDGSTWILQRSLLAVVLVFLSGYLRYVAPGKNVAASVAEEAERLRAEIELAPLRAQAQAAKIRNARGAVMTALGREQQQQQQQQPTVTPGKPRIVAAGYVAPQTQPPQEHIVIANNMMHDWDIPDEVEDDDEDPLGYQTQEMAAVGLYESEPSAPVTNDAKRKARDASDSSVKRRNQRSKIAEKAHQARRADENLSRKRQIREAAYAILDEKRASGMSLDEVRIHFYEHPSQFADEIQARSDLKTRPSAGTARRQINPWYASRAHKARDEQDEQSAVVSDETMAELEVAGALA